VRAVLHEVTTGRTRTLRARFVVAADCIRSRTRQLLGVGLQGREHRSSAIATLFRAPLWELRGERRYQLYASPTRMRGGCSCRRAAGTGGPTA
jgi:2-polyprenyl-6-methoxyphenol hydroxylase-like FAD-dependent oxidoreductase